MTDKIIPQQLSDFDLNTQPADLRELYARTLAIASDQARLISKGQIGQRKIIEDHLVTFDYFATIDHADTKEPCGTPMLVMSLINATDFAAQMDVAEAIKSSTKPVWYHARFAASMLASGIYWFINTDFENMDAAVNA